MSTTDDDLEYYGDDDLFLFASGAPGPEMLSGCKDVMLKATEATMSDPSQERYVFQYGPRQGDPGFLDDLANFLSTEYKDTVNSDNLMVNAGATQGLHLVASTLFNQDNPIFIEDPTYFMALSILRDDLGMTVIPVQITDDGVDLTRLEELLREHREKAGRRETWKAPFWTMLYTLTVFHNPTGNSVSPEKCRQLIQLARTYDVLLLTEDVYNMLYYGDDGSPPRLLTYDVCDHPDYQGCVLSSGTFSKIFAPGMRLGWFEGHRGILELLKTSNTVTASGSVNHYTSRIMGQAIRLGHLSQHLGTLRRLYKKRMDDICQALHVHLPPGCEFTQQKGGLFVWITLPESVDGASLSTLATDKYKVTFLAGESTSPTRRRRNCIRVAISYCDAHQIDEGMRRLGDAIKDYMLST